MASQGPSGSFLHKYCVHRGTLGTMGSAGVPSDCHWGVLGSRSFVRVWVFLLVPGRFETDFAHLGLLRAGQDKTVEARSSSCDPTCTRPSVHRSVTRGLSHLGSAREDTAPLTRRDLKYSGKLRSSFHCKWQPQWHWTLPRFPVPLHESRGLRCHWGSFPRPRPVCQRTAPWAPVPLLLIPKSLVLSRPASKQEGPGVVECDL